MTLRIAQLPHELRSDETALEPLSPELVLVDPELARAARARLAHVNDSLAFQPRLVAVPQVRHGRDEPGEPAEADALQEHPAAVAAGSSHRRWRAVVVASLWMLVGATAAYLFVSGRAVKDDEGGSSAVPPTAAVDAVDRATAPPKRDSHQTAPPSVRSETVRRKDQPRPPRETAPPTRDSYKTVPRSDTSGTVQQKNQRRTQPTPRPQAKPRAQPNPFPTRVFVWPAVAKATFYKVEFFRHGARIFVAWPSETRLILPLRWTYHGRRFRLTRATYHWRVRPAFGSRSRPRYGIPSTRSTLVLR
jgi:hypothetical protein